MNNLTYLAIALILMLIAYTIYVVAIALIGNIKTNIENKVNTGYVKGYTTGLHKGIEAGRDEAMKLQKIVEVNARATMNDIRAAYGFEPEDYLKNLLENGAITEEEFEREIEMRKAWHEKNGK